MNNRFSPYNSPEEAEMDISVFHDCFHIYCTYDAEMLKQDRILISDFDNVEFVYRKCYEQVLPYLQFSVFQGTHSEEERNKIEEALKINTLLSALSAFCFSANSGVCDSLVEQLNRLGKQLGNYDAAVEDYRNSKLKKDKNRINSDLSRIRTALRDLTATLSEVENIGDPSLPDRLLYYYRRELSSHNQASLYFCNRVLKNLKTDGRIIQDPSTIEHVLKEAGSECSILSSCPYAFYPERFCFETDTATYTNLLTRSFILGLLSVHTDWSECYRSLERHINANSDYYKTVLSDCEQNSKRLYPLEDLYSSLKGDLLSVFAKFFLGFFEEKDYFRINRSYFEYLYGRNDIDEYVRRCLAQDYVKANLSMAEIPNICTDTSDIGEDDLSDIKKMAEKIPPLPLTDERCHFSIKESKDSYIFTYEYVFNKNEFRRLSGQPERVPANKIVPGWKQNDS